MSQTPETGEQGQAGPELPNWIAREDARARREARGEEMAGLRYILILVANVLVGALIWWTSRAAAGPG